MTARVVPIGEFARRSRLPVTTLRYYHELGLLLPASVDLVTGYRSYSTDQLQSALLVAELRTIGLSPAAIFAVVEADDAAGALQHERARLAADVADRTAALERLERFIARPSSSSTGRLAIVQRPARRVPMRHGEVRADDLVRGIGRLVAGLRRQLRTHLALRTSVFSAVLPLDLDDDRLPVMVVAEVDADAAAGNKGVEAMSIPAGAVATVVHHGPFDRLPWAYAELLEAMSRADHTPIGPVIEEYRGDRTAPITRISVGVDIAP